MKYSKGRKIYIALSAIALVSVLIIIFILSAQDGEKSTETSSWFWDLIISFFGKAPAQDILRILAHFCEFAGLGFLMVNFIFALKDKLKPVLSILLSVSYAVTDEIHQYFVPERACQLSDLAVDSCGIILGVAAFCILIFSNHKVKSIKNKKADKKI